MNDTIFIDGDCTLCNRFARILSIFDKKNEFKIYPLDSTNSQLNTLFFTDIISFSLSTRLFQSV